MKYRDPDALTFENCTFVNCKVDGAPVPDSRIDWACTCGHATRAEHGAAPMLRWYHRVWVAIKEMHT